MYLFPKTQGSQCVDQTDPELTELCHPLPPMC